MPFDLHPVALDKKEHHAGWYQRGSRTGRVPALQHGDFWLSESLAISEYLAETFPFPGYPRLFPADFKQRAVCRQLMMWFRSDLMPIREQRSSHTLFYKKAEKPLDAAGQKAAEQLLRVAHELLLEDRTTLFPDWCIADSDFAFMLQRLVHNGHPVSDKVRDYVEAQWNRPSVRAWRELERKPYAPY